MTSVYSHRTRAETSGLGPSRGGARHALLNIRASASLLTTHYSHYSLFTTHYSLLTTHYSLLTTHYSKDATQAPALAAVRRSAADFPTANKALSAFK